MCIIWDPAEDSDVESQSELDSSVPQSQIYQPSDTINESDDEIIQTKICHSKKKKQKEKKESKAKRNFTLEEAKALFLFLREHPLSSVAQSEQLKVFKSHQFRKFMIEQNLALRKPKSYFNLYVFTNVNNQ